MVIPKGIVTTAWPRVVAQCADMGISFDEWQHGIGRVALGKRASGKYAATVGGVVLSIPRQVGKTFLVGAIVIALCVLNPGMTVLWTAHRTRTATKTVQSLQGMVKRKTVWPHVLSIRTANGEQEILFRNGSVIMFGAREQGFGRGFDEVDIEVFDEAQILTEKALEDIVPAANQSRHPAGALLFFMGTPPRPSDPGEEFTNRRQRALSGSSEDLAYVEFSADEDADPDDREQWAKANPSYPSHTPLESMQRMRANLTDEASFLREALGVWDAEDSDAVIDSVTWSNLTDEASLAVDRLSIAVDVNPERTMAAVALAGVREDGLPHVELVEHRRGTAWVVPYIVERVERNPLRAVVIDGAGPASSLIDELAKQKVKVMVTGAGDMARACGQFYDATYAGSLRHIGQPQLSSAIGDSRKRPLGDAWAWNRKTSASDITPTVAVTLALWGAQSGETTKPRARRGKAKVVVRS